MERQWEAALATEATVQAEYARFLAQQPVPLVAQDREAIRHLAADIPPSGMPRRPPQRSIKRLSASSSSALSSP
ncbi:MAG TPA: hypothetical protein VIH59_02625 [Candidatus Tectomicrobia bacterium]